MIRFSIGFMCGILTATTIAAGSAYVALKAQQQLTALNPINQLQEWLP